MDNDIFEGLLKGIKEAEKVKCGEKSPSRIFSYSRAKQFSDFSNMKIKKIISGGQTGADRAALDFAINNEIKHGGWCPRGRKAEDGVIAAKYFMNETETDDYSERTKLNVRDSDGSLIFVNGTTSGGTALTIEFAKNANKPFLIFDVTSDQKIESIREWLEINKIAVLNVAGPRSSEVNEIYDLVFNVLVKI